MRSPRVTKAGILSLLVAFTLAWWAGPASAQTSCASGGSAYPPGACQLQLLPSSVVAGRTVEVSGTGCLPNTLLTIRLEPGGTVLGTVTTDTKGAFRATVTIPAGTPAGSATVVTTGGGCELRANIQVLGLVITGGDGGIIPKTGGDLAVTTAAGLGLVAMGGAAMAAARRRRLQRV